MSLDLAVLSLIETQFLPAAVAVLYTADTGLVSLQVRFVTVVVGNQDTAGRLFTLHKVPSGGAVANSNMVAPAILVPAKTMMVISYPDGFLVLSTGQTLRGFTDAANVMTITASGTKFT